MLLLNSIRTIWTGFLFYPPSQCVRAIAYAHIEPFFLYHPTRPSNRWEIFPSLAPLVPLFRTVPNLIAQIVEPLQLLLNRYPLSRQRRLAASLVCNLSQSKPC
jgi:hypothetical protein